MQTERRDRAKTHGVSPVEVAEEGDAAAPRDTAALLSTQRQSRGGRRNGGTKQQAPKERAERSSGKRTVRSRDGRPTRRGFKTLAVGRLLISVRTSARRRETQRRGRKAGKNQSGTQDLTDVRAPRELSGRSGKQRLGPGRRGAGTIDGNEGRDRLQVSGGLWATPSAPACASEGDGRREQGLEKLREEMTANSGHAAAGAVGPRQDERRAAQARARRN